MKFFLWGKHDDYENRVEAIAENAENKHIAIAKDGKTLYLAGNALSKIVF